MNIQVHDSNNDCDWVISFERLQRMWVDGVVPGGAVVNVGNHPLHKVNPNITRAVLSALGARGTNLFGIADAMTCCIYRVGFPEPVSGIPEPASIGVSFRSIEDSHDRRYGYRSSLKLALVGFDPTLRVLMWKRLWEEVPLPREE